jgi:hypothetical protein
MVSNTQLHGHNNASYFTSSSNASATGTNSPSLANGSTDRLTNGTSTPNRETSTGTTATIAGKTLSRGSISGLNSVNGSSHGSNATTSSTTAIEKDQNNVNLAPGMEDTLFSSLKDLFWKISTNKKKTGVIAPVNFINKVKKENGNYKQNISLCKERWINRDICV